MWNYKLLRNWAFHCINLPGFYFRDVGCDPGQAALTAQGKAATFSRGTDSVGKGTLATIQGLSVDMSIFPHKERFVIRLKIPQTVLPFPSHRFTSPRTPVRTSGDKKGQSYFLIWSSLLYSPSALQGRSSFIPRESSWECREQFSKHSESPEEAAAGSTPGIKTSNPHRHRQKSMGVHPAPPPARGSPSHKSSRLVSCFDLGYHPNPDCPLSLCWRHWDTEH